MIYILSGNDIKKKNTYIKKLANSGQLILVPKSEIKKELLFDYAKSVTLFNFHPIVVIENLIGENLIDFSTKELTILKDSQTTFIFIEEKLLALELKKYQKSLFFLREIHTIHLDYK